MRTAIVTSVLALTALALAGCEATSGYSAADRSAIQTQARAALTQMKAADSGLANALDNAYAYAIFPEVGKAAAGVGVSGGRGVVYRNGQVIGYTELNSGSLGAQAGGETFSELILFKNQAALSQLENGNLMFGADAGATAVKAGAAAAGQFNNGTRVFVLPKGGLMFDASISGQKFNYYPSESSSSDNVNRDVNSSL